MADGESDAEKLTRSASSPRVVSDNATQANCAIDYGGFVEPVTDKIIGLACNIAPLPDPLARLCSTIIGSLRNKTLSRWGWRMLDSMAKIPHSLLEGQLTWIGAYDHCESTDVTYNYTARGQPTTERSFSGKYCRLDLVHEAFPADLKLRLGVCVPDSCNSEDVKWYITRRNVVLRLVLSQVLNMTIPMIFCGYEDIDPATDGALQASLSVGGVCVLFLLIATVYDAFLRKNRMNIQMSSIKRCMESKRIRAKLSDTEPELEGCINKICWRARLELLLVGFSAYSNFRRVFTTRSKPGAIPVLDGIRFFSFVYCVWGETYLFGPLYGDAWVTANIIGALKVLPKKFLMQPLINFHLTADSFLLISGILLVYWFLKKYEGENRLTVGGVIYSLVHRYWRLVPALMIGVMILTCTYMYSADGPMWPEKDTDGENCRVTWWVNLLMVQNLVKTHESCFSHAWFVPLVFQLHLAAMFIIVPLVIKPILGYTMLVAAYVAHITATVIISSDLREGGVARLEDWYDDYLVTPWCRAGPFLIGIAFGILIYHRAKATAPIRIPTWVNLLLWVLSLFCIFSVAFWSYSELKDGLVELPNNRWSAGWLTAYDTLARSSWAIGLGYIVFACHFGHGGVIGPILGWSAFTPLSRVVYTSMLFHPLMIFNFVYSNRIAFFVLDYYYMYAFFAHVIVCMLVGLVISLIFDYSLSMGLERTLLCSSKFAWIRAGRHSSRRLKDLENDFYGVLPAALQAETKEEENKKETAEVGLHIARDPIEGCDYVPVSADDVEKLSTLRIAAASNTPDAYTTLDEAASNTPNEYTTLDQVPLITDSTGQEGPIDANTVALFFASDELVVKDLPTETDSALTSSEHDSAYAVANESSLSGATSVAEDKEEEKEESGAAAASTAENKYSTIEEMRESKTNADGEAERETDGGADKHKEKWVEEGGVKKGKNESLALDDLAKNNAEKLGGSDEEGRGDEPITSF